MPKHSPSSLNPRSPLVLDTRDLPRRPGALRTVKRVVPAPADLGVELIGVPEGADLDLDLRLESVSEGVLVSGTISGPVKGECGRCLREINDSMVVNVQELYAYENSTTDTTTDEDEVGRMQDDLIDLEPALRDAVVLTLPTNPLCREDCPGLCPECGVHWDDLPADHSHQQIDPRWAGLSQLTRKEE
ncbi:DNA-binding protein [Micromonospora sicca]|uniref:DNA-binding protein n=1 Tax=Micromonospora sicca TaxID=2202420 RepID=A0A317DTG5_9ACTN|nr:YceD family protein [Micromonospora sp. 4G51]PWR16105.1 DNA-binding protein [Micromonospora sp. 4G51]